MENKKSRGATSIIQSICILYITVWTISPPLQLDAIYRVAALGAVGLWILLNVQSKVQFERVHILAIVYAMLVFIVALMESDGKLGSIWRPINYYMLVITFLIRYCYKDRWNELSWIIPIVLLLLAYFNYQTYKVVANDPTIARLIVRNDESIYHYMRSGVGGYGLLYSQVCILPIIVSWMISAFKKHWLKFGIGVLWLVSYYLYLFNSGYSIAVVASLVGVIILFFYRRSSIVLAVIVTTILILLLIWLIGYNTEFRNALLRFFDGTKVAQKINDIYLSITTTETADSIMERIERYQSAISSIITYPIIGGLWFPGGSGGGHSAIMDSFAKYGVFGGYVFIKIIFDFSMKIKMSPDTGKDIRIANAVFIVVFMDMLLNSLSYNFVCLLMLIIPACYDNILKWRHANESAVDSKPSSEGSLAKVEHTI